MGEGKTPGDSARRSRRGFRYQDVHALDRCLDTIDGIWDEVAVEGEEDVTCHRTGPTGCEQHEQVKTVEDPKQLWSVSKVCQGEKGEIDRSILGKLFLGKSLHTSVVFVLILNEGVGNDLRVLTKTEADRDPKDLKTCRTALCTKLKGLSLPDGVTLEWCVERLSIEVRPREIEELEALVIQRLASVIKTACLERPLNEELETVFSLVMEKVGAEARSKNPQTYNAAAVSALVKGEFTKIDKPVEAMSADGDTSRLRKKVTPLHFEEEAIKKVVGMHLEHRRAFRRADPARQHAVQAMVDDVFSVCSVVAAQRNGGQIAPGTDTYVATVNAVRELHASGGYTEDGFSLADLQRAMWDVTSRCQHRFSS